PGNRMSMPVSIFDEQMAQLRELGYTAVDLDAVLDHYAESKPLPEGAVLITFDDGYRDNLENAAPVLHKHGYPAVQFVPIAYIGDRQPLPHEEHLARNGVLNPTVDWEELGELERLGVRIESHGISHRPLADLELDEAAREIAISKLRLEERLGRPVRAFSYVKGSEAHYKQVHLSLVRQAGYDVAFTAVSGANSPAEVDWWFDRNPAGLRILNQARDDDGTPLGTLAMSCARMSQGLAAFAVHAVTTPASRGRGVFSTLELHNEQEAARAGASW